MPAKNKPITIYLDDTAVIQMEELRAYFTERQGGIKISDSYIGRSLITEKHTEIVDRQNNRSRITTIVEELRLSRSERQDLIDEVRKLREEIRALKKQSSQEDILDERLMGTSRDQPSG